MKISFRELKQKEAQIEKEQDSVDEDESLEIVSKRRKQGITFLEPEDRQWYDIEEQGFKDEIDLENWKLQKCPLDGERSWSFDLVENIYRFLTKLMFKYFSIPATSTEA